MYLYTRHCCFRCEDGQIPAAMCVCMSGNIGRGEGVGNETDMCGTKPDPPIFISE